MKTYAGIGARNTPDDVLDLMSQIAEELSPAYILRSGGADGADAAFEKGAEHSEIYIPWKGYNIREEGDGILLDNVHAWNEVSKHFHPMPDKCTVGVQKLHGRNAYVLLGPELNDPVSMVICWTPMGAITGGTGLALRIAKYFEIPVFNLSEKNALSTLINFVENQQ
ncbi:hypothetical protein ZC03_053 [Pseudomonas phage ZC03]|uniref:DNA recombination-mediator protein A n=1 Tax=Pseudomonas phage ZC03 TaxID=1622115 RepID=A0A1L2C955_9CAUD|nr:DprA-like DNA recombination-mediator protein [Pseudomonas phage ZC03]AMD43430.1 hypothetical protein ZC03_053 [Pseudomonas phage ZC03]